MNTGLIQEIPLDILHLILEDFSIKDLLSTARCSSFFHQQTLTCDRSRELWERHYKRDYSELRLPSDCNYLQAYKASHGDFMNDYDIIFERGYEKKFDLTRIQPGWATYEKLARVAARGYLDLVTLLAPHADICNFFSAVEEAQKSNRKEVLDFLYEEMIRRGPNRTRDVLLHDAIVFDCVYYVRFFLERNRSWIPYATMIANERGAANVLAYLQTL